MLAVACPPVPIGQAWVSIAPAILALPTDPRTTRFPADDGSGSGEVGSAALCPAYSGNSRGTARCVAAEAVNSGTVSPV